MWRSAALVPQYKRGDPICIESWRLILVLSQFALLQEGLVAGRVREMIVDALEQGQSGYIRGVEDPQLLLHELCALFVDTHRRLCVVMGDFHQAFRRTWRQDLLCLVYNTVTALRGSVYRLVVDIFKPNSVAVWLNGHSVVLVNQGIPEGGSMGTLLYNVLPNSLVLYLLAKGHGISWREPLPEAWKGYHWKGEGKPVDFLVTMIISCLQSGVGIPTQAQLATSVDFEASAARAFDQMGQRLVAILHADDPIFLASSRGAMQLLLDDAAAWCRLHNAKFHVNSCKTVVMMCGSDLDSWQPGAQLSWSAELGIKTYLSDVQAHRWLGTMWASNLDLSTDVIGKLGSCGPSFSTLSGLVNAGVLPLPAAIEVFDLKVDSIFASSRWLWLGTREAASPCNSFLNRCARCFLGANPWQNECVVRSELGWHLTGWQRVLRDAFCRYARLQCLEQGDIYFDVSQAAGHVAGSWTASCAAVMHEMGIMDWSSWAPCQRSMKDYTRYVSDTLATQGMQNWALQRSSHSSSPYDARDFLGGPSTSMVTLKSCDLSWQDQLQVRGWCRLRAGVTCLRHLDGKTSQAQSQDCIFCGVRGVRNPLKHVVAKCSIWAERRSMLVENTPWKDLCPDLLTVQFFQCAPGDDQFAAVLRMAADIDKKSERFWSSA